jgi:hypothetical protein
MAAERPMCYSAQVQQHLHKLARQFGTTIDYEQFQSIFERQGKRHNQAPSSRSQAAAATCCSPCCATGPCTARRTQKIC